MVRKATRAELKQSGLRKVVEQNWRKGKTVKQAAKAAGVSDEQAKKWMQE